MPGSIRLSLVSGTATAAEDSMISVDVGGSTSPYRCSYRAGSGADAPGHVPVRSDQDGATSTDVITVVVLHDLNLAARYCDRLVLLVGGAVRCTGEPAEVLTTQVLEPVCGVTVQGRSA